MKSVAQYESLQGLPDLLDALPAGLLSQANLNLGGLCETHADVHHLYEDPRALQALLLLPYSLLGFCLILPCCSAHAFVTAGRCIRSSYACTVDALSSISSLCLPVKPGSRSRPKVARRQIRRNSCQTCYVLQCLLHISRTSSSSTRRVACCRFQLRCRQAVKRYVHYGTLRHNLRSIVWTTGHSYQFHD